MSFGSLPEGYERAVALGVPGMALRFGTGIFADGYSVSVIEDDGESWHEHITVEAKHFASSLVARVCLS